MNTLPMRPAEAVQIGNSCFSFVSGRPSGVFLQS